jgi:type III secretion protein V
MKTLSANPLLGLGRRPDLLLAVVVAAIVGMLIVPLPNLVLDALIAVNIAAALVILMVALFAKNALDFSTFPTLLLLTTVFRLGLNVSTTRGILSQAHAGDVVKSFGTFVLQGDVVVGMVVFLVITLVQFLVIGKGAERVAEVGARFTLDAMPGKQMSIDASIRSGAITEEEGQEKRDELGRLSTLFGNMDGAMKFVKGDAIAGLVITALNLVAGMVIGVMRNEMAAGEAAEVYSILTVGDGLVSQLPALLITLASGVMVTRVESKDKEQNLGFSLKDELFSNANVLNLGAMLMLALAFVPGLPFLPFLFCAILCFSLGASATLFPLLTASRGKAAGPSTLAKQEAFKQALEEKVKAAKEQKSLSDKLSPSVVPIGVDLSPALSATLGFENEEADDETELVTTLIPQLRDALYLETGVRFPGVRVRPHVKSLPGSSFQVRINDVPVVQERLLPGHVFATTAPESLEKLAVKAKPIQHPINKGRMSLVAEEDREVVEAAGITIWSQAGIVALFLASALRKRARDFVGLQEVSELVERLEKAYPALVKEVVPKVATISQLVNVLRRLVDEGVCIRDLKTIVEAMGEYGQMNGDGLFLTERVRAALAHQLAHSYAGRDQSLPVVLLDPVIEDTIADGIRVTAHGQTLSLPPELCREITVTIAKSLQPVVATGKRPVILTNAEIRRFVRKLLETDLPQVAVLSFDELPAELQIQPLGRAQLSAAAA